MRDDLKLFSIAEERELWPERYEDTPAGRPLRYLTALAEARELLESHTRDVDWYNRKRAFLEWVKP